MKRALVGLTIPFFLLIGCTTDTTVGGAVPAGTDVPLSAASLTLQDRTVECGPPPPAGTVPDLAPYPDGGVPGQASYPCIVYNENVGGHGTCCGGDLRVQSCGAGLTCWRQSADSIGVCIEPDNVTPDTTVCVDLTSKRRTSYYCALRATSGDADNCELDADCGDALYQLVCKDGSCSCWNYSAQISTVPASQVCLAHFDDALAAAQTLCKFPTDFTERRVTW